MRSVMAVLLGLAFLIPIPCLAQSLTPEQILAKVSQTYRGLQSFRFVEEHKGGNADPSGSPPYGPSGPFGDRPASYETDLALSAPGKIRLVVKSEGGEIWLVSDGRKTWEYIPNLNEYTETAAAPLVEELWAHPIRLISDDLARYRSLSPEAGHAKLRGEKTLSLGGQKVPCYVVAVSARAGSQTLWIDEQHFIVSRDEWTSPAATGPDIANPDRSYIVDAGVWTSRLTKADLGPISDDVFQFVPPSGARRADFFGVPTGLVQGYEEVFACLLIGSTLENPVVGLEWSLHGSDDVSQRTQYILQGTKARDFTATSLGGENVRLDGLPGKIVVLNFWASWCEPCQEELAAIQKLHDELASKGVVFLGIDDESPETVKDFVKTQGYTFPVLLDSQHTLHGLYGVRLVPTTVVIDRKGKIAAHYVGAGGEAQLRRALKSAGLNTTP